MEIKDYITGLAHIGIPTTDFDRSLVFYFELGFEAVDRIRNIGDSKRRCVFLRRCGVTLELYESVFESYGGVIDHMALAVDDIEAVITLVAKDNRFEVQYGGPSGVENEDWRSKYITIRTPEGEKIEFNQTTVLSPSCRIKE